MGQIYTLPIPFHIIFKFEFNEIRKRRIYEFIYSSIIFRINIIRIKRKKMLYRGTNISNEEVEKLIKFYENRTINKKEFETSY